MKGYGWKTNNLPIVCPLQEMFPRIAGWLDEYEFQVFMLEAEDEVICCSLTYRIRERTIAEDLIRSMRAAFGCEHSEPQHGWP